MPHTGERIMKYMLLIQGPRSDYEQFGRQTWTPEELRAHIGFMELLNRELLESGELVDAQGLAGPDQARLVQVATDGTPVVTDGIFPETKQFLAGFWVLDCESLERAAEIAARISAAPGRGGEPVRVPVEVRQVMSAPEVDM
jgi:hypothetical protein